MFVIPLLESLLHDQAHQNWFQNAQHWKILEDIMSQCQSKSIP